MPICPDGILVSLQRAACFRVFTMSAQTITFQRSSSDPASAICVHYHDPTGDSPIPSDAVLLKFLAAPVNPLDLLVIAGRYPVQPTYSYSNEPIPGYGGLARVERVGDSVTSLRTGDHVIRRSHGPGTWRTEAVVPASAVLKVSNQLDPSTAGLLKTGCTAAYMLLESSNALQPGDWVALNAATGWIARMVVQFARLRSCPSICVIRDRENVESTRQSLLDYGARVVVTELQLEKEGPASVAAGKRVKLALDAVFGQSGQRLAALLAPQGNGMVLCPSSNPGIVGRPTDTTQAYILQPGTIDLMPLCVAGELCLAGPQLASGYLTSHDDTKSVVPSFVENPFGPGRMFEPATSPGCMPTKPWKSWAASTSRPKSTARRLT